MEVQDNGAQEKPRVCCRVKECFQFQSNVWTKANMFRKTR